MTKDPVPLGKTAGEGLIVVSPGPSSFTSGLFLGLVSFLDRFYDHPMLKLDPAITVFLCIAMLLYIGSNISQYCVETLLLFFDFAQPLVQATPPMQVSFRYPRTVERLVDLFDIGNKEYVFACCPECFRLYTLPDYQPLKEPTLELPCQGLPQRRATPDKGKGAGDANAKGKGKAKAKAKAKATRKSNGKAKGKAKQAQWKDSEDTSATSDLADEPPSSSHPPPRLPSPLFRCSYQAVPTAQPCNARLSQQSYDPRSNRFVPIRKYVVADLSEYLARLHACKGFEEYVDQRTGTIENASSLIWGPKDGPFARSIKDSAGEPFLRPVNNESRLTFSIFIDWFNPHSGKHHSLNSVGAVYLVCLDLPAHLRHTQQYMLHLANIPGPKEPSMEQMNHVLRPIVDQLLELWRTGIWLSRTQLHRYGRVCRGIIINLSGDLPGIQKTSGLASHSHPCFCFLCQSPRSQLHNLDLESWGGAWPYQEHRDIVLHWKHAETQDGRHQIYRDYGFRYSELSRLPYLDIIRATTLDSMHIMSLGLQKDYGENILGMKGQAESNSSESGSSDSETSALELSDEEDGMSLDESSGMRVAMDRIMKELSAPNSTMTTQKLALKPSSILFSLCKEQDIFLYYAVYHGKRPQRIEMAKLLMQKVFSLRLFPGLPLNAM